MFVGLPVNYFNADALQLLLGMLQSSKHWGMRTNTAGFVKHEKNNIEQTARTHRPT